MTMAVISFDTLYLYHPRVAMVFLSYQPPSQSHRRLTLARSIKSSSLRYYHNTVMTKRCFMTVATKESDTLGRNGAPQLSAAEPIAPTADTCPF